MGNGQGRKRRTQRASTKGVLADFKAGDWRRAIDVRDFIVRNAACGMVHWLSISPEAARIKGIESEVAGRAQIIVVPDREAGKMLAKNLSFLANADAAGIVLGARVPIILTSRANSVRTRVASCAIASLYADALRRVVAVPAE